MPSRVRRAAGRFQKIGSQHVEEITKCWQESLVSAQDLSKLAGPNGSSVKCQGMLYDFHLPFIGPKHQTLDSPEVQLLRGLTGSASTEGRPCLDGYVDVRAGGKCIRGFATWVKAAHDTAAKRLEYRDASVRIAQDVMTKILHMRCSSMQAAETLVFDTLCLQPNLRGRGRGKWLFKMCVPIWKKWGYKSVVLFCHSRIAVARANENPLRCGDGGGENSRSAKFFQSTVGMESGDFFWSDYVGQRFVDGQLYFVRSRQHWLYGDLARIEAKLAIRCSKRVDGEIHRREMAGAEAGTG